MKYPYQVLFLASAVLMSVYGGQVSAGVELVKSDKVNDYVVLGGTVVPYREVILTAQIPGRVNFIGGVEGDKFNNGDLLVAIDDADLQAKKRALLAELNKTQASLSNAHAEYNRELWNPQSNSTTKMPGFALPSMFDQAISRPMGRVIGAYDDQASRQADLYNRGVSVQQATADVMRAQSMLEELDTKIRDARSISPFAGVVTKKLVEAGDTVSPGQALIKFAQAGHLCVEDDVPVRMMGKLDRGDVVTARLDQAGETKARVAQVYPVADVQQHTVKVKFDLPVGVSAGPGMYAEVFLPTPSTQEAMPSMPSVPKSALVRRGSLPSVYVVNDQDQVEMRAIRLGRDLSDQRVLVLAGLKEGERVVNNPPKAIASGWMGAGDHVLPPVKD
jgi:RND family efflux transporter MFP subunit